MNRFSRKPANSPTKAAEVIERLNCSEEYEQIIIKACQQQAKKTQDNSVLQTSLSIQLAKVLQKNVSLSVENSQEWNQATKSTYCQSEKNPANFIELKLGEKRIRVWVTSAPYNMSNKEWRFARESETDGNLRVIRQHRQ